MIRLRPRGDRELQIHKPVRQPISLTCIGSASSVPVNRPIPGSLKPSNRAGFYWDYTPPRKALIPFVSSPAQMLRQRVQTLQTTASQTSAGVKTRGVAVGIGTIRQDLATIATRGIVTVYDATSRVPGAPIVDQPEPSLSVVPAPADPVAVTPPPSSEPAVPTAPVADRAATSVTILVEG
jgi:hypothetical protein